MGVSDESAAGLDMAVIVNEFAPALERQSKANTVPALMSQTTYHLSDFDFELDPALIAQHPAPERTASRLLNGEGEVPQDLYFRDLPQLLRAGDLLVFNDTKVIKARLFGQKPSGGQVEILVERVLSPKPGEAAREVVGHIKVSRKPTPGSHIDMAGYDPAHPGRGFRAEVLGRWPDDQGRLFHFRLSADAYQLMDEYGHVPLPPYITHGDDEEDERRYQTVFAKNPGAVAAPTAALHFDEALLAKIQAQGVHTANVTLHVGAGTFAPVKDESLDDHHMHAEWYRVPESTAQAIVECKARGGRVIAVGTTTVRTLESWAISGQPEGDTQIFIKPGYVFHHIDALITNFHLPKSTLLMLVSAFTGHEHMHRLYAHATSERYRFFSYGDAMWLTRKSVA